MATKPLKVRKRKGRWYVMRWDRVSNRYEMIAAYPSFDSAMAFVEAKILDWQHVASLRRATAPERLAQHLAEWDKRHHLSGRRKVWPRVRNWWTANLWRQAALLFLIALVLAVAIVLLWPHQPDSVLPPDLGRPDRPPHPRSIYTPKGG